MYTTVVLLIPFQDNFGTEFVEKLKEFKNVASSLGEDSLESLKLVDAVLRLGIEYHFQEEIDRIIQCQYMKLKDDGYCEDGLYEVALRFRLFRQQGYHVSAGVHFLQPCRINSLILILVSNILALSLDTIGVYVNIFSLSLIKLNSS